MSTNQLRPMTATDLELVLAWRNHDDIRRYMYTQHEISLAEHTHWFERTHKASGCHLLVFEVEQTPSGFIQFTSKGDGGIADWGFYLAPEAPKGTGSCLGKAALRYGFADLKLHKVCGQALDYNSRSIRFHQSMGFTLEGVLRQQHYDGQKYHDIHCFGILAKEWAKLD
ncbi:UDP-4-amino-4,6-dideoxy-N-acetyl-beta-L-altrosamine N-acetyltransferase [Idiomarina abyssalis]|uniref:UDP-4-amino-4, 6-dideoxy-N-acetyl-beta-L-altrosamine N-acetyltransferase n=1 Tax=Idiomarina abyssalis TaxID=86102 RepID=UPI003A92F6CE